MKVLGSKSGKCVFHRYETQERIGKEDVTVKIPGEDLIGDIIDS